MRPCYAAQLGQVMAERFGGQPGSWTEANRRILADWDSYYADLDLGGEHGLEDLREGEVRTTRALFRLTQTPEPDHEALMVLARELPYQVSRRCDTFYSDSKPVLERLHAAGYILGIASHATSAQSRGILEGGSVPMLFKGPILGPDVTESFIKNRQFFAAANLDPQTCLVVDSQAEGIRGAKAAGMRTVQPLRRPAQPTPAADHVLHGDLTELLAYLGLETK